MRRRAFFRGVAGLAAALALGVATTAQGRPAGGHGYSGSPSRSGGGSGSSGSGSSGHSTSKDDHGLSREIGQLIVALVTLAIQNPVIGVPLLGALLFAIFLRRLWAPVSDWMGGHIDEYVWNEDETSEPDGAGVEPANAIAETRASKRSLAIETIQRVDADFSLVVFEDFLQMLYARVHDARGVDQLEDVAPYVTEEARRTLRDRATCKRIEAVVIGSISLSELRGLESDAPRIEVDVRFEANLTEIDGSGQRRGVYVVETWTMARARGLTSRPPERAQTFDCPMCGAPLESRDVNTNRCPSCGQVRAPSEADWALVGVELEEETVVPPALTTHVEERGTDAPTIVDANARARLRELETRAAGFSWDPFVGRVRDAYGAINAGWSERDLGPARPYMSDAFFRSQLYWVAAYQDAKLRNVMEAAQIEKVALAEVRSDRWFDALTIRIFADGLDYTVREGTEEVVSGSRSKPRKYSEYWTFVRSAHAKPSAHAKTQCPECGAPVEVEMTGQCRHCHAHVTSGEFDWVLSRIEQDESYGR